MIKLTVVLATLLVSSVALAEAPAKPRKPTICLNYSLAKGDAGTVAICHDGKRPYLLTRFAAIEAPGEKGGTVKAIIGWR